MKPLLLSILLACTVSVAQADTGFIEDPHPHIELQPPNGWSDPPALVKQRERETQEAQAEQSSQVQVREVAPESSEQDKLGRGLGLLQIVFWPVVLIVGILFIAAILFGLASRPS
jgi:hypothetical protein